LGILLEVEIGSISEVQEVKNYGKKLRKVKVLRFDNGGEYTSMKFKAYLECKGIEHQLSISGRSERNEVAEHMNRTFKERACGIKLQADMSEGF